MYPSNSSTDRVCIEYSKTLSAVMIWM